MAKRTGNVPTLNLEEDLEKVEGTQGDQGEASPSTATVPTVPLAPKAVAAIAVVKIDVPLMDVPASVYRPRHININLGAAESDALKRLVGALDENRETLASGRRVQNGTDAVRWLLERVAKASAAIPPSSSAS